MNLHAVAESLTAAETLKTKFATNGGSLGSAQTLSTTPDPPELWVDKTDASVGVGTDALRLQTEIQFDRGGTNTLSPKLLEADIAYILRILRSNKKAFRIWDIPISIDPLDQVGHGLNLAPETIVDDLRVSHAKRTLLTLDLNLGVTYSVIIEDFPIQYTVPKGLLDTVPAQSPGWPTEIMVRCREAI